MKKILIIAGLAAVAIAVYFSSQGPEKISVSAVQVARENIVASVSNTRAGTVDACRRSGIAPATGGNITALYVDDGDRVKQGQLLLELWNADLQARVELSKRDAAAAASTSRQSCVTAKVSRRTANRLLELEKTQVAAKDAVEKAVGDAEAAAAACAASKDIIKVREAAVDVASANLERTLLRAPFDGVIAEINGELGEFVTPSPVGVATLPTVDLIDNSCLFIRAPIDEIDAPKVSAGLKAWISLDAYGSKRFSGRVRRVAPYVLDLEKQSRTVDVEAVLDDPEMQVLLPGYSADVQIIIDQREAVLVVPSGVIREDGSVLVVAAGGGELQSRQVKAGLSNWELTEVISGLSEGEYVVRSIDREGVAAGVVVAVD